MGAEPRRASSRADGARGERIVCMLCPGRPTAGATGGIGSALLNLMAELPRVDPSLRLMLVDTRGSGHIAFSPVFYLLALARVAGLALAGRNPLLHLHLSGYGSTVRKFGVVVLARLLRLPVLLHLHGGNYDAFYRSLPAMAQGAVRWMFAQASRVIVLGDHWKRFVAEEIGVAPGRIDIICNGVPSPLPAEAAVEPSGPAIRLVFLGRLEERKGVSELLAALASPGVVEQDWQAVLAGDGDATPYRKEAQRLGIADRVSFPGWLDRAGVARLLRGATILALPSRAEALPMAVLEALANRVPVVTTPVGSLSEFLVHEHSALLVEPGDVEQLARALGRLMRSPELRASLAEHGLEVFRKNFDITAVARDVASAYRKLGPIRGGERSRRAG